MPTTTVEQAYRHCQTIASQHYENFPVASILLPRPLRKPVSAIYAFARMADDIADEGTLSCEQRRQMLARAEHELRAAAAGRPDDDPVYIALSDALHRTPELLTPLLDLLKAFNMDIDKQRYASFGEVMQYCRYSANPIGRMLLILYDETDERKLAYADAVCSALQIINFLQDVCDDYRHRDRIYMPADELQRFGVREQDLDGHGPAPALAAFMEFQLQRTLRLLQAGAPLGIALKGRIGLELRMVILAGWKVLEKLHRRRDRIALPTRLGKRDWMWIIIRAISSRFKVYLNKTTI